MPRERNALPAPSSRRRPVVSDLPHLPLHAQTHIEHSPNCSVAKLKEQLGFEPRHGSIDMVVESAQARGPVAMMMMMTTMMMMMMG